MTPARNVVLSASVSLADGGTCVKVRNVYACGCLFRPPISELQRGSSTWPYALDGTDLLSGVECLTWYHFKVKDTGQNR